MRTPIAALSLAAILLSGTALADTPTCDRLDRHDQQLGIDIEIERGGLVVERDHRDYLRIDKRDRVFVGGKELSVPPVAKPTVAAYREGFLALEDHALAIGKEGARIGASAVTGLLRAMFTTSTMEDYEREMEARGEAIEAKADALCAEVEDLARLEADLTSNVPGFPAVLTAEHTTEL